MAETLLFDLLRCMVCYGIYDPEERIPMVNSSCGHTVCSYCLTQITICPLDKQYNLLYISVTL
jgi:hypothetical protein